MIVSSIRFEANSYDQWKVVFDRNEHLRRAAGALGVRVFRSAEEPSSATVLVTWSSGDQARAFLESDEVRAAMADAGVTGPPRVELLEPVEDIDYA